MEVEPGVTSGDYLSGFFLGTRQALFESNRESLTITISEVSPFTVGVLIALFERAVGFYAALTNINAYHQPGVEAGKKAATTVIQLKLAVLKALADAGQSVLTIDQLAEKAGADDKETIFKICEHLSANPNSGIVKTPGANPFAASYRKV